MRRIIIELEDLKKHLGETTPHQIEIDFGGHGFQGQQQGMEYSIWCKTCGKAIGNTMVIKND